MQNVAARFVTGTRRRDHITPILQQLHRLPVQERVEFKRCPELQSRQQHYTTLPCQLLTASHRQLRSSETFKCSVLRTRSRLGNRAFIHRCRTTDVEQSPVTFVSLS